MKNKYNKSAINFSHSLDIESNEKGKCIIDSGFIQWPYLDEANRNLYEKLLVNKGLPKTLTLSSSKLKSLRSGNIENYFPDISIKDLMKEIKQLGVSTTLKSIFKKLGYVVNEFDGKYNIVFSLTKNNSKTLVMVKNRSDFTLNKHIPILKDVMKNNDHQRGLIVIYDNICERPTLLSNEPIDWLDREDLENL